MDFSGWVQAITGFISLHPHLALGIIFLLAFGKSLAIISLAVPATTILLATGVLLGASDLAFVPFWLAAAVGAFAGEWASWWLGYRYSYRLTKVWPLSRNPHIIQRGHRFFERWGAWGVFFARFLGPLRAVVPLIAGICTMPVAKFQLANASSAIIWGFGILAPGALGLPWLAELF